MLNRVGIFQIRFFTL